MTALDSEARMCFTGGMKEATNTNEVFTCEVLHRGEPATEANQAGRLVTEAFDGTYEFEVSPDCWTVTVDQHFARIINQALATTGRFVAWNINHDVTIVIEAP